MKKSTVAMNKSKHEDVVDQLDQFYQQAKRQILQNQSAITGLFPSNSAENQNASIKTSLWAASSIFALYLAYSKRVDNDKGKAHDLGQSVVKCMRGILFAWMRQSEKVESFKANQSPRHALHLKFDLHSGLANDNEFPHLQIDVVSLYLIFLANFIASGLDIIYCMDEVTFIQNLVYYVERAYRTPDFGNWEMPATYKKSDQQFSQQQFSQKHGGTGGQCSQQQQQHHHNRQSFANEPINYHNYPTQGSSSLSQSNNLSQNQGLPNQNSVHDGSSLEIHATSIGMAKSALEAINGCNLFGGKGANWSIIYSDIDAHSRNRSIFETLLPRESRSKNTDSYLLATISWPCFATHDPVLYQSTKSKILRKLKGKYGLKRFLRDSYGTALDLEHHLLATNSSPAAPHPNSMPAGSASMVENINPAHQSTALTSIRGSIGQDANMRQTSISSTASNSSSLSLGEPPKSKQRKSSYHQRKINPTQQQQQQPPPLLPNVGGNSNCDTCGGTDQQLLQRMDSTTKMSKRYEHIESEWPLFVCFLIIDGIFKQDMEQIYENEKLLYERLLKVDPKHDDYLMPKYYYVPLESVTDEKCNPDSVERTPSAEGSSTDQVYLTGQSLLLITRLLLAGLVHPNELDPLRRHMPSHDRPKRIGRYSSFQATSSDLVVQTVLIAESIRLQAMMANYGIQTQTPLEVEPVQIWSSAQLVKVYEYLGVNEKLGLKGRPSRPIGALGTSKLYRICGQTILCYPLIFEVSDFYLAQDMLLLIDDIQNELNFIGRYWRMSGRPTVCILIREEHLRDVHFRDLLDLLVQFKNGQLKKSGLRIKTGRLQNLISSSCIEHLDFLHLLPHEHLPQFKSFRQLVESPKQSLLNSTTPTNLGLSSRNMPPGLGKSRRNLCSASSHHLAAIEEQMNASSGTASNDDSLVLEDGFSEHQLPSQQQQLDEADDQEQQLDFNMSGDCHKFAPSQQNTEQCYSTTTSAVQSIDYYECYKDAPTWPTLVELLRASVSSRDSTGQSQLLALLCEREGAKFCVDELAIDERLEQLSQEACQARNWSVVRYCSAVLKRSVESLSPWLTSILVNGKQISLGTGSNERIINNPLTPIEIHQLIYSTTSSKNPCDAVLQQEIALYIGRLISTRPDYFEGILTIRVTNFMSAMRSYLNIKTQEKRLRLLQLQQQQQQPEGDKSLSRAASQNCLIVPDRTPERPSLQAQQHEQPQQLLDLRLKPDPPPSASTSQQQAAVFELGGSAMSLDADEGYGPQIKVEPPQQRTKTVNYKQAARSGKRNSRYDSLVARPLESLSPSDVRKLLVKVLNDDESMPISDRRQITGELCRVPRDFYDKVWSLLSCTNIGIVIGGKVLRSAPTLTNMTQDDLNFALKVESLLSAIDCPKLRQVNVELLMGLHVILERNPEIRFETDPLDLDKIISLSLDKFRSDYNREDYGLNEYYAQPVQNTTLYTIRTVFDCLLPVRYKGRAECKLS